MYDEGNNEIKLPVVLSDGHRGGLLKLGRGKEDSSGQVYLRYYPCFRVWAGPPALPCTEILCRESRGTDDKASDYYLIHQHSDNGLSDQDYCRVVTEEQAAIWLGKNSYDLPEDLTEKLESARDSMQVPWDDGDKEYMPNSKAIALVDNVISLSKLSKLLAPDGPIRYMPKAQRCKVHVADFVAYCDAQGYLDEPTKDQIRMRSTREKERKARDRI